MDAATRRRGERPTPGTLGELRDDPARRHHTEPLRPGAGRAVGPDLRRRTSSSATAPSGSTPAGSSPICVAIRSSSVASTRPRHASSRSSSTRRYCSSTNAPTCPRPNGVWDLGSAEAAEIAKLAETTYRDVNIAFANELARFADASGVDVYAVIDASNSQPFSHIHRPGIAVGGHCIPVYPRFYLAGDPIAEPPAAAREINDAMPAYAVAPRRGARLAGSAGRRARRCLPRWRQGNCVLRRLRSGERAAARRRHRARARSVVHRRRAAAMDSCRTTWASPSTPPSSRPITSSTHAAAAIDCRACGRHRWSPNARQLANTK